MSRSSFIPTPGAPHQQWICGSLLLQFNSTGTNAHRLYSSDFVWIERFGEDLLVSYKDEVSRDLVLEELPGFLETHQLKCRRVFGKLIPRQNEERVAPVLLEGDASLSLETVVEENGMKFGLDFGAGYSAGLFIDQRANRALLRRWGVKKLLNTFAYTCSFSVAAALVGAQTTSVDLSKKSIDRGRENFGLNGIGLSSGHRFYADDVLDLLPRLARKGELFDVIILDPPTFSRGNKGRRFQVENDFEELLLSALEVAAPQAKLLLSTNCARMNRRTLESIARFCLQTTRRAVRFHSEAALPDLPAEFGAQTLWIG